MNSISRKFKEKLSKKIWYLNLRNKYHRFRRKVFEMFGSEVYSRPSLNNIDKKLEHYLAKKNGFFIEVGANNGFAQSNTYYLERFKQWQGILIEPIPELYKQCVKERANSQVFNCALVSNNFQDSYVTMKYSGLMSLVAGVFNNKEQEEKHIQGGMKCQKNIVTYEIRVPARTLTSILEECHIDRIDFLSLDVEGFELEVLKGLNFKKYKPNYLLIETEEYEMIISYLESYYQYVDNLTHHDYLFKRK